MKNFITLQKNQNKISFYLFLLICIGVLIFVPEYVFKESNFLINIVFKFVFVLFTYLLLDFGNQTHLYKDKLIVGNYHSLLKKFVPTQQIILSEDVQIKIKQNQKQYFEIFLVSGKQEVFIEALPNKIPAEKKAKELENKIFSFLGVNNPKLI